MEYGQQQERLKPQFILAHSSTMKAATWTDFASRTIT